jgi:hypothetical protein
MVRFHHGLRIELPDSWWRESEMDGFSPLEPASRVARGPSHRTVCLIPIADIGPVRRSPGVGIFNDDRDSGLTARERVLRLLRGFRLGQPIPPIEVVEEGVDHGWTYKLTAGTHRLYCSLVVGFTLIPAVKGFDITA